jgi:hypothetical protein
MNVNAVGVISGKFSVKNLVNNFRMFFDEFDEFLWLSLSIFHKPNFSFHQKPLENIIKLSIHKLKYPFVCAFACIHLPCQ